MCGLFGVLGPGIITKDLEIFKHLGFISMIRGIDGAGIFETNTKHRYKGHWQPDIMFKVNGDFSYLLWALEEKETKKKHGHFLSSTINDVIMGHVRWRTRGKYTVNNSHPFNLEGLVGFHNGTLNTSKYIDKTDEMTDSELLFRDIDMNGIIDVLPKLGKDDAYAIAMYDKTTKNVVFSHNGKRTLFFAQCEDRHVLYYASESHFLKCALDRFGIKYRLFSIKPGLIVSIRPDAIRSDAQKIFHILYNPEAVKKLNEKLTEVAKKKEEKKVNHYVQKNNKVVAVRIYDISERDKNDAAKAFCLKCTCGKHRLNVFDSYMTARSAQGYPVYDSNQNRFECTWEHKEGEVVQ